MAILSGLKRALTGQGSIHKTDVVTFSRLDYWTMLELFDRIPLHDLVRLNGLASWWSGYVHKVCLIKRSITVNCGYKADQFILCDHSKDSVKVVTIDSTTSDRLGHLLPNIISLDVIIGGSQSLALSDVIYLISQWSHQLFALMIEFDPTFVPVDEANYENGQFNGLFFALNRITNLRRLTIRIKSDKCHFKDPIDLPILSQLEDFYFHSGEDDFVNLRDSLVQYAGPNMALKYVELPAFKWFNHLHNDFEFLEQQVFSKFTNLRIINATRDKWALFPNLYFVSHQLQLNSRSRFMELISEMKYSHMHNLSLTFCIGTGFDRNSSQVLTNPPPLKSVIWLELNVLLCEKHVNLYSSYKSLKVNLKMFPNVQAVRCYCCYLYTSPGPTGSLKDFFSKMLRKISLSILYRKLKRRVQLDFPNVKCTFDQIVDEVRDRTDYEALFMINFIN